MRAAVSLLLVKNIAQMLIFFTQWCIKDADAGIQEDSLLQTERSFNFIQFSEMKRNIRSTKH